MTNPNMDVSTQTVCWFCWETLCNTVRQRLTLSLYTSVKRTADMPHTSCIILFWRLCSPSPYTHTSANMKKRSRTHKCKGWGMNTEVSHTKRIKNTELNRHLKHTSWTHTHTQMLHFKCIASSISAHSWTPNHTCSLQIIIDFNSQVRQIAWPPELLCPLPTDWSCMLVWHEWTQWNDCEATLMPGQHSRGCWKPEESLPAKQPERLIKPQSRAATFYITYQLVKR